MGKVKDTHMTGNLILGPYQDVSVPFWDSERLNLLGVPIVRVKQRQNHCTQYYSFVPQSVLLSNHPLNKVDRLLGKLRSDSYETTCDNTDRILKECGFTLINDREEFENLKLIM